jgi:hypothetical protein
MASQNKKVPPTRPDITITEPDDQDWVFQYFGAEGDYTPGGLFLRAQLRSTGDPDPTVGSACSMLIEHDDFYVKNGTKFNSGFFQHPTVPFTPPDGGVCHLHVWGYANEQDAPGDFVVHDSVEVTIIDLFPIILLYHRSKRKARKRKQKRAHA